MGTGDPQATYLPAPGGWVSFGMLLPLPFLLEASRIDFRFHHISGVSVFFDLFYFSLFFSDFLSFIFRRRLLRRRCFSRVLLRSASGSPWPLKGSLWFGWLPLGFLRIPIYVREPILAYPPSRRYLASQDSFHSHSPTSLGFTYHYPITPPPHIRFVYSAHYRSGCRAPSGAGA